MKVKIDNFTVDGSDRKVKVQIDRWDTFSAYNTICEIVLPLLKQFKLDHTGSPYFAPEDVPERYRGIIVESYVGKDGYVDDMDRLHAGWDWIIDEMIYAFHYNLVDFDKFDKDFDKQNFERANNGMALFAKYFRHLWW